jgi:hypothetical protein
MRITRWSTRSVALVVITGLLLGIGTASASAQGLRAFVLSNNTLIPIDTFLPQAADAPKPVAGLLAGDTLVGIGFRPQNGLLYGLGYNSGAGTVQLYAISIRATPAALAVPIGVTGTFVGGDGATPVPIQGTNFGFDFNPAADRIRVVNDAGQNFRIDPNTGAFVDGDLGGAPASVPGLNMDGAINGATTGVSGAAYTNNEQRATITTLYTLRAGPDTLYIQNTPGSGTETAAQPVTGIGGVPLAFAPALGFDIPPGVDVSSDNAGVNGLALAALTVGGVSSLYAIALNGGVASLVGRIGDGTMPMQGLAIQGEDRPGGLPAIAVDVNTNTLIRFNTAAPGATNVAAVTGLVAGEVLAGIDWRPQTGQLVGLGVNAGNGTGSATLYRLDPQTGTATIIGVAGGIANGAGAPIDLAHAATFGFDVNPATDRIRVVTNNGLNFRINPNDGSIVGGTLDPPITGLPNGSTGVTAAAYTNSYGQDLSRPIPVSTLYTLDPTSHQLFIQAPLDTGIQSHGVPLTASGGGPLAFEASNGFDIPPGVSVLTAGMPATGPGYAVLTVGGLARLLYRIDLGSGLATEIGLIGAPGQVLSGLAIGDSPVNPTGIALTSSANPATAGQPVTLTATLAPADVGGNIFFGSPLALPGCAERPIVSGVATCTTTFTAGGTVNLIASFNGDLRHAASQTMLPQVVIPGSTATATTVTAGPNPATVGKDRVILVANVSPSVATGTVTFFVDGSLKGTFGLTNGTASTLLFDLTAGTHTITATYGGDVTYASSSGASVPLTVTATPTTFTQYFAEGATGNFFHTDLGIFNASAMTAHVQVTAFPESGASIPLPLLTLDPASRRTIDLNAAVGGQTGISILVESDQPVAATRQMSWGNPVYGSTLESGAASPSLTWHFAEGATNLFSLFFLVENPNATPTAVTLTHLLEGGGDPVVETAVLPPFTRRTFFVNDVPGLRFAAMSTVITADQPIVAERAMYLNTTGRLWEGGASSLGATALSQYWQFAEGATGFFHTYLLLGNPNPGATTVTVSYNGTAGVMVMKTYEVAGRSRRTVDVNGEDPKLVSTSVGMAVSSTLPIVAERAMWWGDPWTEGSASLGAIWPAAAWAIGEGAEGGAAAESTFVLMSYEGFFDTSVSMTVVYDDGTSETKNYQLFPNTRTTVRIADDFPSARNRRFSVSLNDTFGDAFTVEVARYQSPTTFGDGGGAALATRIK